MNKDQYQRLLGKLIYLTHTTLDSLCCEYSRSVHASSKRVAFSSYSESPSIFKDNTLGRLLLFKK